MSNKYCMCCGTSLPENAKFCYNCGSKQEISNNDEKKKTDNNPSIEDKVSCKLIPMDAIVKTIEIKKQEYPLLKSHFDPFVVDPSMKKMIFDFFRIEFTKRKDGILTRAFISRDNNIDHKSMEIYNDFVYSIAKELLGVSYGSWEKISFEIKDFFYTEQFSYKGYEISKQGDYIPAIVFKLLDADKIIKPKGVFFSELEKPIKFEVYKKNLDYMIDANFFEKSNTKITSLRNENKAFWYYFPGNVILFLAYNTSGDLQDVSVGIKSMDSLSNYTLYSRLVCCAANTFSLHNDKDYGKIINKLNALNRIDGTYPNQKLDQFFIRKFRLWGYLWTSFYPLQNRCQESSVEKVNTISIKTVKADIFEKSIDDIIQKFHLEKEVNNKPYSKDISAGFIHIYFSFKQDFTVDSISFSHNDFDYEFLRENDIENRYKEFIYIAAKHLLGYSPKEWDDFLRRYHFPYSSIRTNIKGYQIVGKNFLGYWLSFTLKSN